MCRCCVHRFCLSRLGAGKARPLSSRMSSFTSVSASPDLKMTGPSGVCLCLCVLCVHFDGACLLVCFGLVWFVCLLSRCAFVVHSPRMHSLLATLLVSTPAPLPVLLLVVLFDWLLVAWCCFMSFFSFIPPEGEFELMSYRLSQVCFTVWAVQWWWEETDRVRHGG